MKIEGCEAATIRGIAEAEKVSERFVSRTTALGPSLTRSRFLEKLVAHRSPTPPASIKELHRRGRAARGVSKRSWVSRPIVSLNEGPHNPWIVTTAAANQ